MVEKIMIFIDGSNIHHAVKRFQKTTDPNFKIDYLQLIKLLTADCKLIRPYYYGSRPVPPRPEQESFYKKLQHSGITVRIKNLRCRGDRAIEKGVDVALVTEMLSLSFKNVFDTAVIVSGDNDLIGAIEEIKQQGKRVEVAAFKDSVSSDMQLCADKFISLDELANKIKQR